MRKIILERFRHVLLAKGVFLPLLLLQVQAEGQIEGPEDGPMAHQTSPTDQGSPSPAGLLRLDQIVIHGRRPVAGDVVPLDTTHAHTRIAIDPAVAGMTTVEELMEREVGVQIRRFGGPGSTSQVSLRASSPQQVSVYIDGIPLNPASSGSYDLSNISLDELEAIEIYRGSSPASFGASPMGGVVNLVTRKLSGERGGHAEVNAGSFGTRGASLDYSLPGKIMDAFAVVDHLRSDGDYKFIDDGGTTTTSADDHEFSRVNNDLEQTHAFVKLGARLTRDTSLELSHDIFDKDKGIPGRSNNQTRHVRYGVDQSITHMKITADRVGGVGSRISARLHSMLFEERFVDTFGTSGELGLGQQDNENQTREWGLQMAWQKEFFHHTLDAGYRLQREEYRPEDKLLPLPFPGSDRDTHHLSLQDAWSFLDNRLALVPSVQAQFIDNSIRREAAGLSLIANDDSDERWNWNLGSRYQALAGLLLRANVGTAVRLPTFSELFGDRGVTVGNNDLRLEESVNWDVGLDWDVHDLPEKFSDHRLSLGYFEHTRKNLIQFVFDGRGVGKARNISRAEVRGVEIEQGVSWLEWFRFSHTLTLIDDEITASPFATDIGKRIPGIYDKTYTARAEFFRSGFKLYYELFAQDEMFYDKSNLLRAAVKNINNAGASYRYRRMEFALDVKNFTDEKVEDFGGWPLPGLGTTFSFKLNI